MMEYKHESSAEPSEQAAEFTDEFERCLTALQIEGEPLNIFLSQGVRESLEMYLKRMVSVMVESDAGIMFGEMAISNASEALPHVTKGMVREALIEYLHQERQSNDRPKIIEGLATDGQP